MFFIFSVLNSIVFYESQTFEKSLKEDQMKKKHNEILSIPQQMHNTTNDSDTRLGASVWIWAVSDRLTNRAMVTMSPSNFSASFPPQAGARFIPEVSRYAADPTPPATTTGSDMFMG